METITAKSIRADLLGHLATFGSRRGLLQMSLRAIGQRFESRWFVVSAGFIKRILDIAGSLVAIALLSPVLIVAGALVKLDGGPMIFAQTRIGRYGRMFKMFKFR